MTKPPQRWLIACFVIVVLLVSSCSQVELSTSGTPTNASANAEPVATPESLTPIQKPMVNSPRLEGKATVVMVVNGSPITIEVDGTNAPLTAGNFVDLVQKGVYDSSMFHRVVRDPQPFVVQGGDPQSKDPNASPALLGTGSYVDSATKQPRLIPLEIKPEGATEPVYSKTLKMARVQKPPALKHSRGAVAMARSQNPDSASSQFYFALADLPFLDGDYAVFGYVKEGMNVVDKIQQGDRIESAKVTQGADNLKQ